MWCGCVVCLTPEYEKVHSSFCKRVRLIGPKNGHRMAQCMIYQRQPVNIAMSKHGTNKAKFELFQTRYLTELSPCVPKVSLPLTESLYTAYYERYGTLLPNVAVYCETPLGIAKPLWKKVIRVLNLIGLAFDNSKQPDLRAYDAWKGQNADKNASLWLRPRVRAQLKNVGAVLNWASSDKKILGRVRASVCYSSHRRVTACLATLQEQTRKYSDQGLPGLPRDCMKSLKNGKPHSGAWSQRVHFGLVCKTVKSRDGSSGVHWYVVWWVIWAKTNKP